jgi:hypothetical protein
MRHALALTAVLLGADLASAQVRVRAPFVRVEINGGVHVRAPFVNLYVPGGPPVYVMPPAATPPAAVFVPPAPAPIDDSPAPDKTKPLPPVAERDAPPPAVKTQHLSVEDFVKSFKPKAGNYEVELVNPVTGQPTPVRFTLPEGEPRRIHVSRREIEFDYGPRRYVKIQFDSDGALVIWR